MSEFNEDQEIVLDIIKNWYNELDAAFLAKEGLIVHWSSLNGDVRNKGWVKLKLREAASIVRATRVPVGVMKYCTEDMFRAGAQEEGRTYIQGCTVVGDAADGYFNYNTKAAIGAISEKPEHKLAVSLIAEFVALDENVMWCDLAFMYEKALERLSIPVPHAVLRNKFLRYGLSGTQFIEKRNNKRYNGRYVIRENGKLRQLICIKLPHRSGMRDAWGTNEMRKIITQAITCLSK